MQWEINFSMQLSTVRFNLELTFAITHIIILTQVDMSIAFHLAMTSLHKK
jgi:hypothetical protein